jgi:hypothetical protein
VERYRGRDIGEIHRRREGGKETEGNRHRERDRGEHAREEREEEGGREGEGDRGEDTQGRDI